MEIPMYNILYSILHFTGLYFSINHRSHIHHTNHTGNDTSLILSSVASMNPPSYDTSFETNFNAYASFVIACVTLTAFSLGLFLWRLIKYAFCYYLHKPVSRDVEASISTSSSSQSSTTTTSPPTTTAASSLSPPQQIKQQNTVQDVEVTASISTSSSSQSSQQLKQKKNANDHYITTDYYCCFIVIATTAAKATKQ